MTILIGIKHALLKKVYIKLTATTSLRQSARWSSRQPALYYLLTVSQHWTPRQLDIQNAFLHGDLVEDVFMVQPQ